MENEKFKRPLSDFNFDPECTIVDEGKVLPLLRNFDYKPEGILGMATCKKDGAFLSIEAESIEPVSVDSRLSIGYVVLESTIDTDGKQLITKVKLLSVALLI